MNRKRIIFASAHRYRANTRLGTSYLAEAIADRGWEVIYIEQPTSPFHLVHHRKRKVAADKFRNAAELLKANWKGEGSEKSESRVSLLNVVSLFPHVNIGPFRSKATLDHWWRVTFPSVTSEIRKRGFAKASAFVFDSPFFFPLARALSVPSVYRYADRMKSFSEVTPAMLELQTQIFQRAELILYTAKALEQDLSSRQGQTLYLPNGVDLEAFRQVPPEPPELTAIPYPRVIYSGMIGPWFDGDLVYAAARELPDVQYVLLGKNAINSSDLATLPNVHFLGEVPFNRVSEFLLHSQAAIIPFDMARMPDLVAAINPLKLYEYCAAGLPVITYPSAEIEAVQAPAAIYHNQQEFTCLIREALSGDSVTARRARRAWAETASWHLRAARLEEALETITGPAELSSEARRPYIDAGFGDGAL